MTTKLHRLTPSWQPNNTSATSREDINSRIAGPGSAFVENLAAEKPNAINSTSIFWKALVGLLSFDLFGLGRNFVRMHKLISHWKTSPTKESGITVDQVCRAVNYACLWYPKRVRCLQRSAITTCLMRHFGVPATMVLGAQLLPFKAHAWTEVEGSAVNERRDVQNHYEVLDRF